MHIAFRGAGRQACRVEIRLDLSSSLAGAEGVQEKPKRLSARRACPRPPAATR